MLQSMLALFSIGKAILPLIDSITSVQVTLTGRDVPATNTVWPLNYSRFNEMAAPNDYIYVSRYLITGADAASLYLKVFCHSPTQLQQSIIHHC